MSDSKTTEKQFPPFLVDEQCFELARHFLPKGTEDQLWSLADDIQHAVEDWFDGDQERGNG